MPTTYITVSTITVEEGETLWSIAERELGDGHKWRDLFIWNVATFVEQGQIPQRVGPDFVKAGTQLKVLREDPEFEPSGN